MHAVDVATSTLTTRDAQADGSQLRVTVENGSLAVAPLLRALERGGYRPGAVVVERPSLDDVFLTMTGRTLREGAPAEAS